jgi:hypothetical protein
MQASGLAVSDEMGIEEIYLQPEYDVSVTEDELDALEQLDTPPQYASPMQGLQWNSPPEIFASFSSNPFGS